MCFGALSSFFQHCNKLLFIQRATLVGISIVKEVDVILFGHDESLQQECWISAVSATLHCEMTDKIT